MRNLINKIFRKNDWQMVAIYITGPTYIYFGLLPYVKVYSCYENAENKRKLSITGGAKVNKKLHEALKEWTKHKIIIPSIPTYDDITNRDVPIKGIDDYNKIFSRDLLT